MVLPVKGVPLSEPAHPHLPASAQLGDQIGRDVDHRETAKLVLPPPTDTPVKRRHEPSLVATA
jgi:hypothetical protein